MNYSQNPAKAFLAEQTELFCPAVEKDIEFRAQRLIELGLRQNDRDDIKQELRLEVVKAYEKFIPGDTKFSTFSSRVLDRRMYNVYNKLLPSRLDKQTIALNGLIPGQENLRIVDTISNESYQKACRYRHSQQSDYAVLYDAIALLPEKEKEMSQAVLDNSKQWEAAYAMELQPSTFSYHWNKHVKPELRFRIRKLWAQL